MPDGHATVRIPRLCEMTIEMKHHRNHGGLRPGLYCSTALLALLYPLAATAAADMEPSEAQSPDVPTISVTAPRFPFLPDIAGEPAAMTPRPAADGGDFLRSVPGISGSRMGGHGIDPVIRGMQGNQINITTDNIYTYGGCPNRMDPPSSFVPVETFDLVTVSQGYRTVTKGPGGSAGRRLACAPSRRAPGNGARRKRPSARPLRAETDRRNIICNYLRSTQPGCTRRRRP